MRAMGIWIEVNGWVHLPAGTRLPMQAAPAAPTPTPTPAPPQVCPQNPFQNPSQTSIVSKSAPSGTAQTLPSDPQRSPHVRRKSSSEITKSFLRYLQKPFTKAPKTLPTHLQNPLQLPPKLFLLRYPKYSHPLRSQRPRRPRTGGEGFCGYRQVLGGVLLSFRRRFYGRVHTDSAL